MFFYELHEGDDQVYSDVLVVSESEWEPQEFFDVVQRIRHDVQDHHEQDTLIEAIALVLERDHGFVFVSDDRLVTAVNVSTSEDDNFMVDLEEDDDDDDDDDGGGGNDFGGDYRTIVTDVEFDIDGGSRPN